MLLNMSFSQFVWQFVLQSQDSISEKDAGNNGVMFSSEDETDGKLGKK